MLDLPPTPPKVLIKARKIALGKGLNYVYVGNIRDDESGDANNTICPKCKEQVAPDKATVLKLKEVGLVPDVFQDGKPWRGKGCDYCFGSGYVDRTAIYEILPVDDTVKEQIMSREGASTIKKTALERGIMKTLRMDGISKVLKGMTTVDEVLRITQLDTM